MVVCDCLGQRDKYGNEVELELELTHPRIISSRHDDYEQYLAGSALSNLNES